MIKDDDLIDWKRKYGGEGGYRSSFDSKNRSQNSIIMRGLLK